MKTVLKSVQKYAFILLAALAVFLVGDATAFAAGEGGVTVTEVVSATDITSMITDIGTSLGTVVKAALGLAVGLFIVRILYRVMRSYLRQGA